MLWNLTCERGFHSTLLEAGVTGTLLELLGPPSTQSMKKVTQQTKSIAAIGGGGGVGGVGGGGSAGSRTTMDSKTSVVTRRRGSGSSGTASGEHGNNPSGGGSENAQDGSSGIGSPPGGGGAVGSGPDAVGAIGGGTTSSGSGHIADAGGKGSKSDDVSTGGGVPGAGLAATEVAGMGHKPSLEVRRNVLGAVMNLTSLSISDPRLDPSAVMSLLTHITREDPIER